MVLASPRTRKIPLWADFAFLMVLALVTAMTVSWQSAKTKTESCVFLPYMKAEVLCDAAASEQVYE
ncbi:hypothetical protein QCN27_15760 [Cereibacter sp. SYSU M97828]|nr:hypothetical protein [Cereibacter flavus]